MRPQMTPYPNGANPHTHSLVYEIRVQGKLVGNHWSHWFDSMSIISEANGETVLRGTLIDQAALYGVLARLRDLALPLISVNRITV